MGWYENRHGGLLHDAHVGGWIPPGYHLYQLFNSELAIAATCNNISTSLQMYRLCGIVGQLDRGKL